MAKYNWHPILEMDLDDGTHTCYCAETKIGNETYFVYCTQMPDDTWDVELLRKGSGNYVTLVNCKTLTSAKRWVARYL